MIVLCSIAVDMVSMFGGFHCQQDEFALIIRSEITIKSNSQPFGFVATPWSD
jgi:hypothetical protein